MRLIIHRPDLEAIPQPKLPDAPSTTAIKLRNLKKALKRWAEAGCRIAPHETRKKRFAICSKCTMWNPQGNFGFGECKAPGCGCTRAKMWLASEACPLGGWGAENPPSNKA